MSLIDTDACLEDVECWRKTSDMTHVLHTESLNILSAASGNLEIEPFCVPDLDRRIVGFMVYHCCDTGDIHSFTELVVDHLHQIECDTCVQLKCWELNPKCAADEIEVCWNPNPCKRAHELLCCKMDWLKNGKEKSIAWRDSSETKSYLSEAELNKMIAEAELECDYACGRNTRCITFGCPNGGC